MKQEEKMTFAEKMAQVAKEAGSVAKDKKNLAQNYSYASAAAVLNAVRTSMASLGLYISSSQSEIVKHELIVGEGRAKHKELVLIKKTITVTDGEHTAVGIGHGSGMDWGDKAAMKAETAATKYAVSALFLVSWDDDPEGPRIDEWLGAIEQAKGTPRVSQIGREVQEHYVPGPLLRALRAAQPTAAVAKQDTPNVAKQNTAAQDTAGMSETEQYAYLLQTATPDELSEIVKRIGKAKLAPNDRQRLIEIYNGRLHHG